MISKDLQNLLLEDYKRRKESVQMAEQACNDAEHVFMNLESEHEDQVIELNRIKEALKVLGVSIE